MTPLLAGLVHPLSVPMHLMAVLALALLIGQQGWGRSVPIVYFAAVLGGFGAIAWAYVPTRAAEGLLVSAAFAGVLVALGRPFPQVLGCLLGAIVGATVALDSPPEAIMLREANLMLVGTALGLAILLLVLVQGAAALREGWWRIGARILGSWIAASAILVLALRIVR